MITLLQLCVRLGIEAEPTSAIFILLLYFIAGCNELTTNHFGLVVIDARILRCFRCFHILLSQSLYSVPSSFQRCFDEFQCLLSSLSFCLLKICCTYAFLQKLLISSVNQIKSLYLVSCQKSAKDHLYFNQS